MRYPLPVAGMEGKAVELDTSPWTGAVRVLVNGKAAPAGPKKREYLLTRSNGTVAVIQYLGSGLDFVPRVTVDGITQTLAPPLQWFEWILVGLPITLVFIGGGLGGLFGGIAVTINLALLRGTLPTWSRYLAAAAVTAAAFALFIAAAIAVQPYLPKRAAPAPIYGSPAAPNAPGFPGVPPMPGHP